jgi:hypothetical protein
MSGNEVRTVAYCESCKEIAEDVQRVEVPDGEPRPYWGTHACRACRRQRGLTEAPRQPRAVRR